MATWLHEVDIFQDLADGEPGRARDWGTTRLALAAPERYAVLPEDERCHDIVLAAGPERIVASVIEALRDRRPCTAGLANAAAAVSAYGLVPEDTEPLAEAVRAAMRNDGDEADVWLAFALTLLQAADPAALSAAAKVEGPVNDWLLPLLVLQVADRAGALEEAAKEVAADVRRGSPYRLIGLLDRMGAPIASLMFGYSDLEEAVKLGAALAHAEAPKLKYPPGSAKRRAQFAVKSMLIGVPGSAAALLRALYEQDPRPEWGLVPVAVAAWLGARSVGGHGDVLHDVIFHAGGGDAKLLSEARRTVTEPYADALVTAISEKEVTAGVVAMGLLRRTGNPSLARALVDLHGGDVEAPLRVVAMSCVAAWHVPDDVPALLRSEDPAKRTAGLVVAEWVPTQEVLEALLQTPVPADPALRLQYARDLASMGDAAVVPTMEALVREDESGELDEARALAEEVLRISLA
jgi:hypothetical protein